MPRAVDVVVTMTILSTACGLPFPSAADAAGKFGRVFRGLRTSSKMLPGGLKRTPPSLPSVVNHSLFRLQNVYCNSIGCPNGYTPIDDAAEVKCDGNDCRAAQCCEAFCSYHACPDNYTPVDGADSILCDNDGCTTSLCCNNASVDTVDDGTKYCNCIGCPNGYTPVADAGEVKCKGNDCRPSQCCEAFCSYFACPNSYIPVDDADTILCDGNGCTTELCCDRGGQ